MAFAGRQKESRSTLNGYRGQKGNKAYRTEIKLQHNDRSCSLLYCDMSMIADDWSTLGVGVSNMQQRLTAGNKLVLSLLKSDLTLVCGTTNTVDRQNRAHM